ncbi:MAG TPA: asparaginase [Candidatus Limnocylindrales bacterium]|jgi:L-asparaginase
MARVAVVFTGGTISMRVDAAAGGAVPTLDGAAILARTTGLAAIADVAAIDWGLVPASHLSFAQLIDLAATVRTALEPPDVAGAVVVQGTDVIDETGFALDLLVPGAKPVVVTGAMRTADDDGYEGPANLRAAVRVAASPAMRHQGALVVLDGTILAGDDAIKAHTSAYRAFVSANEGPLGRLVGDRVQVDRRRGRRRWLPTLPEAAVEPIDLVTAVVGQDGRPLRLALAAKSQGIVVAATGAGNSHPDLLAAAQEAMAGGVPVVLTTRVAHGEVSGAYAFPGGGARWLAAGAIPAGTLGGPKARIALALGLGAGLDDAGLRRLFAS